MGFITMYYLSWSLSTACIDDPACGEMIIFVVSMTLKPISPCMEWGRYLTNPVPQLSGEKHKLLILSWNLHDYCFSNVLLL